MIKHFVFSESSVTAVLENDAGSLCASMCRDKNDRPSWDVLCSRLGCKRFASVRDYARNNGIAVYG